MWVLNGVYDYYQRGRVSNILKTFNHANMNLEVDGRRIGIKDISNYHQTVDMKKAILVTTFDVGDKLSVKHSMMALRHLPYTALTIVELKVTKEVKVTPMSVIEAPTHRAVSTSHHGLCRLGVLEILSSHQRQPVAARPRLPDAERSG